MAKIARPKVVTKERLDLDAFPENVQVTLRGVAVAARDGVLALSVAAGLQVIREMMQADLTRLVGPKGKHDPDHVANRHGSEARQIVLGGGLVDARRPRARSVDGREVTLPTWELFSARDMLDEIAIGRTLAGLSMRRHRAGEASMGDVALKGTSRSAISRRFRRVTETKLAELFGRDLSQLDLLAVFMTASTSASI